MRAHILPQEEADSAPWTAPGFKPGLAWTEERAGTDGESRLGAWREGELGSEGRGVRNGKGGKKTEGGGGGREN